MIDAIIVLGHCNDDKGNLSSSTINRLNHAIKVHNLAKYIVLSAGFGQHFNTSSKPHSFWMEKYLLKKGILKKQIMQEKHARWTIENASLCLDLALKNRWKSVLIVTSSWHVPRTIVNFALLWPREIKRTYYGTKDQVLPRPKLNLFLWETKGIIRDASKIIWFKITGKGLLFAKS